MSKNLSLIVGALLACALPLDCSLPCLSQTYNQPYRIGLAYYNAGNFKQAFEQFNQLLAQDPNNARLHYYAGNCLVKLGRIKEAVGDYRNCILLGNDSEASALSERALATWDKPTVFAVPLSYPLPGQAKPDKGSIAAAKTQEPPGSRKAPAIIEVQAAERAKMIAFDLALQIKNLTDKYERWSKADREKLAYDIKNVSKKIEIGGGGLIDNPDYDAIVARIKQQAQDKANDLQADYQRRVKDLTEDSTRRQEQIIAEGANVKSMYARDSGFSRMMPGGSNLYVRNYLNQSGMDDNVELIQSQKPALPPALSAVAQPITVAKPDHPRLPLPVR